MPVEPGRPLYLLPLCDSLLVSGQGVLVRCHQKHAHCLLQVVGLFYQVVFNVFLLEALALTPLSFIPASCLFILHFLLLEATAISLSFRSSLAMENNLFLAFTHTTVNNSQATESLQEAMRIYD